MKQLLTLFPQIISNTDLSLLSQCHLRYFRERIQHLRRKNSVYNEDLSAGGAFAKGIQEVREAYYKKGLSEQTALEMGKFRLQEEMEKEEETDEGQLKSPERMKLALETYFKKFPLADEELIPVYDEEGKLGVEYGITAELPILHPETGEPLIFKGKLDLLGSENGKLYILDEKTTKAIPKNQAALLQASGQFLGYAWLAQQKGHKVSEARIRKVSIQVKEIKVEEFVIPLTQFAIDRWYEALLDKLISLVLHYDDFRADLEFNDETPDETVHFTPDYQLGCTAFYRPCSFIDACTSKGGHEILYDIREDDDGLSAFKQVCWDAETRTEIPLRDMRIKLGLEA